MKNLIKGSIIGSATNAPAELVGNRASYWQKEVRDNNSMKIQRRLSSLWNRAFGQQAIITVDAYGATKTYTKYNIELITLKPTPQQREWFKKTIKEIEI